MFWELHAHEFCTMLAPSWCYGFKVQKSLSDDSGDDIYPGVFGEIVAPDVAEWVAYVRVAANEGSSLDGGWSPGRSLCVRWDIPGSTGNPKECNYKSEFDPELGPTEFGVGAFDIAVLSRDAQPRHLDFIDTYSQCMLSMHGAMQEYMSGLEALFDELPATQRVRLLDHVRYERLAYEACCEVSMEWWAAFWDM